MKYIVGILLAAGLLSGCASVMSMPYNAREACVGSGGTYESSSGTCWAGLE